VVVLGYEIARLKISENMDEDELKVALDGITSEIPDLRQRLIENFIRMLVARVLPKASERIITALRRKDIPEDVLDSLMFSIEVWGTSAGTGRLRRKLSGDSPFSLWK
jgi:hypothetical protein